MSRDEGRAHDRRMGAELAKRHGRRSGPPASCSCVWRPSTSSPEAVSRSQPPRRQMMTKRQRAFLAAIGTAARPMATHWTATPHGREHLSRIWLRHPSRNLVRGDHVFVSVRVIVARC
jgi:hypothetical protein